MANRPAAIDADHLVANPRALDALNQSVIREFRANQGEVGGPMEGMPTLLLTTRTGGERLLSPTTLIDGSVRTSPLKVRRNSQ
jgi:hypothetical protein